MHEHIVIVGGGFGGLTAAVRVARSRKGKEGCRITLIDRQPAHVYFPLIYEVATGFFDGKSFDHDEIRHGEDELKTGASIAFEEIAGFLKSRGVHFRYEEVVGIDWSGKAVRLADGTALPYDKLVLAMGSVPNTFGIPGLDTNAHMLYSLRGALGIRRNLHHLVDRRRRNQIPFIRIIVGGAGPTGVEFACETATLLRKLVRKGVLKWSDFSIIIIDAADRPLKNFDRKLSAWAMRRFEQLNIRFLSDTLIKGTHRDHVVIASKDLPEGDQPEAHLDELTREKEVIHEMMVWTGGSKANPALGTFGLPLDAKGRVEVDAFMQVRGKRDVWAMGDCTVLTDPETGHAVPPLAQAAIAQGETVARNVIASCDGKPLRPYRFPKMGAIVPLGGTYSIADVYGLKLRGPIVQLLKLAAEGRYFFRTLPFPIAWRTFRTAFKAYRKND